MTEQEAIKWLKAISATQNSSIHKNSMSERKEALHVAIQALEEIQQYRAMKQRLNNVYGDCDDLLEKVVAHLEKHENTELPEPVFKAKLLIDDEVDRWEAYKAIGTVEECQKAVYRKDEHIWETMQEVGNALTKVLARRAARSYPTYYSLKPEQQKIALEISEKYPYSAEQVAVALMRNGYDREKTEDYIEECVMLARAGL